jgi:hypothetical protein
MQVEIKSLSSERLSEIVIANRCLGLYKELSVKAMEELALRRSNGDTFEFEKYISESLNDIPPIDAPKDMITNIMDQIKRKSRAF